MATYLDKKLNFASRLIAANKALLDTCDDLANLKAEWDANAYATGATPTAHNITDADLTGTALGFMTAADLNSLIGAHVSVNNTVSANRGYLEAGRGN